MENPFSQKWPALSPFKMGSLRGGRVPGAGEGKTHLLSRLALSKESVPLSLAFAFLCPLVPLQLAP